MSEMCQTRKLAIRHGSKLRPVVPARPLVPPDNIVRPLKAAAKSVPVTYMTANGC